MPTADKRRQADQMFGEAVRGALLLFRAQVAPASAHLLAQTLLGLGQIGVWTVHSAHRAAWIRLGKLGYSMRKGASRSAAVERALNPEAQGGGARDLSGFPTCGNAQQDSLGTAWYTLIGSRTCRLAYTLGLGSV